MSAVSTDLDKLKHELQNEQNAAKFQHLAAALLERLLDVPIVGASSGFQHGADAGPAGQQGRRFRLECKRYRDTSRLRERELLGEVEQALARDEALEAWALVTTCTVPEQIRQSLDQHGVQRGVPIVIIDWTDHEIAPLAALCASSPDLVETLFSTNAGKAARAVQPESGDVIERLRRNLESWCLGFESLRRQSHDKLDKIWNYPQESNSVLGQNAAGGFLKKKVKRNAVQKALSEWWRGPARSDAPAAVIGFEGVGKTWATLDWLIDSKPEQPVVLIAPSSAATSMSDVSESNLKRFLAERLHEVTGVRDSGHWLRRLDHFLKRPADEGPVLTVVFDGLNQEPSVLWVRLLQVLQSEPFVGRIRVIASTRQHHFENKLSKLSGLVVPAEQIEVNNYDAEPGGELDRMLKYEDLVRADLHSDVLEMARTPRLFKLVVRFRDRFVEGDQITLHRLLWEYGRDTLGISFSEDDWRDWLKDIARQYREGIREYSIKSLGETVSRPDLTEREVYARLSDIIDGRFAARSASGDLQLTHAVVAHALGAALLNHLDQVTSPTFEALDVKLNQWLDPIAGFDEPSEILRAAVSILVEQGRSATSPAPGVLLTAWLQHQNVTDVHRQEIADLAPNFSGALLDAVENSDSYVHESARHWAVRALCAIPRTDCATLKIIVERTRRWLGTVYRDIDTRRSAKEEHGKWRSDQLKKLIGTDSAGLISVAGVELELVDQFLGLMKAAVPSILESFPLVKAIPTFEAAAAARAATDQSEGWDGLKWLCLLNEVDPEETAMELRDLSEKVRRREPEPGVHPDLPKCIAALLLWMTGQERDDAAAASLDPGIDHVFTYEKDYLPQPGRSWFPLERRHAQVVLHDMERPLQLRIQRIGELWLDPSFVPPEAFVAELRNTAACIDVEKLNRTGGRTIEDHNFEELEPALARCAPDLLAVLVRRKLRSLETCPLKSRYWSAISATAHFVLSGEAEAAAARTLRLNGCDDDTSNESYAASQLLLMEIRNLDGRNQVEALIEADLMYILFDFTEVLRPLTPEDVDALINRYTPGSQKQQQDLLKLLAIHPVQLTDDAWSWVEAFAKQDADDLARLAFKILAHADLMRFGRTLWVDGWSWNPAEHIWVNDYGSDALIEATLSLSFDELVPRLAPWRLLEAVRRRGADPTEVRLAAAIFGVALTGNEMKEPDPGSNLAIDLKRVKFLPFSYSVEPRRSENEAEMLRLALDSEANMEAHRRATETAASRIDEAWRSGAHLLHAVLDKRDFEPILRHAPEYVEQWLEGCSGPTAEFQRRVRLAEGAFLALCEALLIHDPERGSRLWHVLCQTITTRYIGEAGVEDLLHMVFRIPDSPAVAKLRDGLAELKDCHTDRDLFDFAIAASHSGKIEWLNTVIEEDQASPYAWRRARATVLEGFSTNNTLPIRGAWPDGELKTNGARLTCKSARSKWIEACAHHWWRIYLKARDPADAYAAWVLFLRSADRRIWVWMQEDIDATGGLNDFFDLKMAHVRLNRNNLKRALKKREEKFDQNFLYRKVSKGIGPWV